MAKLAKNSNQKFLKNSVNAEKMAEKKVHGLKAKFQRDFLVVIDLLNTQNSRNTAQKLVLLPSHKFNAFTNTFYDLKIITVLIFLCVMLPLIMHY